MSYQSEPGTFTSILNSVIEDKRLTPNAFRVLTYLMSKKDDWEPHESQIATALDMAPSAVKYAMIDLRKYAYLSKQQVHKERGRFSRGTSRLARCKVSPLHRSPPFSNGQKTAPPAETRFPRSAPFSNLPSDGEIEDLVKTKREVTTEVATTDFEEPLSTRQKTVDKDDLGFSRIGSKRTFADPWADDEPHANSMRTEPAPAATNGHRSTLDDQTLTEVSRTTAEVVANQPLDENLKNGDDLEVVAVPPGMDWESFKSKIAEPMDFNSLADDGNERS